MSDRIVELLERLQSAQLRGRTSSAMKPLLWLVASCLSALTTAAVFKAAPWVLKLLGVLTGGSVVVSLGIGIYFAIRRPDALRSEEHVIKKMAIERGLVGDSAAGLINPANEPALMREATAGGTEVLGRTEADDA